jgi:hypothetical protein
MKATGFAGGLLVRTIMLSSTWSIGTEPVAFMSRCMLPQLKSRSYAAAERAVNGLSWC